MDFIKKTWTKTDLFLELCLNKLIALQTPPVCSICFGGNHQWRLQPCTENIWRKWGFEKQRSHRNSSAGSFPLRRAAGPPSSCSLNGGFYQEHAALSLGLWLHWRDMVLSRSLCLRRLLPFYFSCWRGRGGKKKARRGCMKLPLMERTAINMRR